MVDQWECEGAGRKIGKGRGMVGYDVVSMLTWEQGRKDVQREGDVVRIGSAELKVLGEWLGHLQQGSVCGFY